MTHEETITQFVKNHTILQHLKYVDEPVVGQEIVGLLVKHDDNDPPYYASYVKTLLQNKDNAIIDPNWDEIYNGFLNIDHNLDSVEYLKNLVEESKTRQDVAKLLVTYFIKPLIESNVDAKTVYVVIGKDWATDWLDKVIEV